MIECQIRTWEVLDQDVLDLLYVVPREEFVPPAWRALAFADLEIPLESVGGEDERMWAPKMEARVLQAVAPRRTERVLEVGTGSGHLAALLAQRAREVLSVEIRPALAEFGRANLRRLGIANVEVMVADGARGPVREGPWDVIVLTGSVPILPQAFADALAPGGRLFAVVGEPPVMSARLLTCAAPGAWRSEDLFETLLLPLVGCERPPRFRF